MKKSQGHRNLIRERITVMMVLFFCFLISSSEYIIQDDPATVNQEHHDQDDTPSEGETFISAAVDAVVPFVFAAVGQVVNLIYEIEEFRPISSAGMVTVKFTSAFFEILLEKIISTNAP